MDNNGKTESENCQDESSQSSPNKKLVENLSFEDACKFLEAVALEVAVADQQIIDLICERLSQENEKFGSDVIDNVCKILAKLNHSPSVELLHESLNCLKKGMNYDVSN